MTKTITAFSLAATFLLTTATYAGDWTFHLPNQNGIFSAETSSEKDLTSSLLIVAEPQTDGTCMWTISQGTISYEHKEEYGLTPLKVNDDTWQVRVDTGAIWYFELVGVQSFNRTLNGLDQNVFIATGALDEQGELLRELMDGNTLRIKDGDRVSRYSLAGSSDAIAKVADACVAYAAKQHAEDKAYFDAPDGTQVAIDPDAKYF